MKPRDVEVDSISRDAQWPDDAVFTVGHSTLPIERFIALLHAYGIRRLADVRTVPRSRRNPQFNADALASALRAETIEYVPLPRHSAACVTRARIRRTRVGATKAFAATQTTCRRTRSRRASTR